MSSILQSDLVGNRHEREMRAEASRAEATIDAGLVHRFTAGDEGAFREIVHRHRRRIFSVVGRCLRDRADVEEVVADTFIRAYRGLGKFRGDASLATWLYRIAINLARNRHWFLFRRRHLAPSLDAPISTEDNTVTGDLVPSEKPDPAEVLNLQEYSGAVVSCLERLPACQRDILKLRGLLDNSYEDIAAQLGLRVGTVKSRIARARRHLRREVAAASHETPIGPMRIY